MADSLLCLDSYGSFLRLPAVIPRIAKILVVFALAGSIGLHWVLLQMFAWAGMVVSYSHDGPVTEAVAKTFDGQHPCKLCVQIAKSQRSEKKTGLTFKIGKLEFRYASAVFVFQPPILCWETRPLDDIARVRSLPPPGPPPRFIRA